MDLTDVWPLFRLRLLTPRLELRIVTDGDLGSLVDAALAGIHDPRVMPFSIPWTDAEPGELRRSFAQHQWRLRAGVRPEEWTLNFAVRLDGVPVGVQDLAAEGFSVRRTVSTGSWLTAAQQARGIGAEMRAAVLMFAFDHLGAEVAESSAADWNTRSLGVSRRLGYRDNGRARREGRPGEIFEEVRLRLNRDDFRRPDWALRVEGVDAARGELLR